MNILFCHIVIKIVKCILFEHLEKYKLRFCIKILKYQAAITRGKIEYNSHHYQSLVRSLDRGFNLIEIGGRKKEVGKGRQPIGALCEVW